MSSNLWQSEYISSHEGYSRLMQEYKNALDVYEENPSPDNQDMLSEIRQELKAQQKLVDVYRQFVIIHNNLSDK